MLKTIMIKDGVLDCEDRLDFKINRFIKDNKDKKIVDIKFASIRDRATALIIYEVEEDV